MEPHTVKTVTLGQKHRNYNKFLNEAIKNNPIQQITAINCEESDLDNILKIDIACHSRNVEFVLEALKCEDMLYVSRVIKKSTWLITDQQYSCIVNSEYLHNNLYPHMTSKAFNKLVLHVRLNLKDERRAEEFFNHYKKDLKKAFSWLPQCSLPFIENMIRKHANEIPRYLLKRLYEKSFTCLQLVQKYYTAWYYIDHMIEPGKFLLNTNLEEFLNIIESLKAGDCFPFGQKYTRLVMEKNPKRIINNLEKYVRYLDIATFAKYLKREEIKSFILTHIKNKNTRFWFSYKKIDHFLHKLPFEERFDFVNKLFIEKAFGDESLTDETWDDIVEQCNLPLKFRIASLKNIWSWYVYAPFDKAFTDLKQMIRKESNPTERLWILRTLLTCAVSDQKNIYTLLKYYHENHMSDPFIFKVQFVNHLITKSDPSKYNEEAWGYLNDLLNSMDVSSRPKDSVGTCVKFIILYNVTHDKHIPEVIESKFDFEYFIKYEYNGWKHKFNTDEREKIFNYFYKYYTSKIINNMMTTEEEFDETVNIILKVLTLLTKWNKEFKDYPIILQTIKDLVVIKKENSWHCDLSGIYNFKKSWRRLLFPESIILNPTQESCINALKHDPCLIEIYRKEINSSINENVPFNRFLKKIRIDWYRPMSDSFKTSFKDSLNQKSCHNPSIKGLCTLLLKEELLELVQKYVPQEAKIDWSQPDDIVLSIRKNIATYMHLARPQPPLNVVLLYAKGDYLHYVLPSLSAIFYNINSNHIRKHVAELLDTPVSLQKHAIRVAFSKLNHKELRNIFSEFWQSSKNKSTRKGIFCETYKKLCKESDETVISDIWELLSMFIDQLTFDENKKIYSTLSKINNVPPSVRAEFQVKSHEFFKKAPVKLHCENLISVSNIINDMEFLDSDVMAQIFFENFDNKFTTKKYDNSRHIAIYLLSTKSESVQRERYEKILEPLVEKTIAVWNKQHENIYYARKNLRDIFDHMSTEFEELVLKKEMAFPIAIYTDVLNKLQKNLSIKENYFLLTHIKLSLGYIKTLYDVKTKCTPKEQFVSDKCIELINMYYNAAPAFGYRCLDHLKEDIANNCSTIYVLFAQVLKLIFDQYNKYNNIFKMRVLKSFLDSKDFIEGYLVALELIPSHCEDNKNECALKLEILREISTHPSEQIAMHYWHLRKDDYSKL